MDGVSDGPRTIWRSKRIAEKPNKKDLIWKHPLDNGSCNAWAKLR
jgi:hypothetical protein